jgi:squalene monooxygenase
MKRLKCPWTLSRGFYLNMGAIWLHPCDSKAFPINAKHLEYLISKDVMPCPALTDRDIWDRSKADKFAKMFACLQIFWLAVQSAGRGAQKLPVTPLEIATLGFMIPSLATFVLWGTSPSTLKYRQSCRYR